MKLPIHQIDAFTHERFRGNPAAVVPLPRWLDDATLQAIAAENNLAETAFFVEEGDAYPLRWFTPVHEVDLCGHATLAAAHVILRLLHPERDEVRFSSQSGPLAVRKRGEWLELDFPSRPPQPIDAPPALAAALGGAPVELAASRDYFVVYASEEELVALRPDFARLAELDREVIVTAPGRAVDFVSRFFAPRAGIPEDPVTGSAHCTLVPYWSRRLGKRSLEARQLSARTGELRCEDRGERVAIAGRAVAYLEGAIYVDDERV
ncbi:MAG TPA: PhzF family phenazine biosynthesis protein [Polyangia bacterium]|nr:PhzF family phenazine biosynthesis protein [Polyangia bacterium]